MRVLLVGDTHGSRSALKLAFEVAADYNCSRIFQLGDFGFWPKMRDGNKFLQIVHDLVDKTGLPFYWLAGNHEDWNDLDYVFTTYLTDDDGFHKYGNLRVAPRSNVWTWDGMHFANMSGAFSIDKKRRTEGLDWFPQELPTPNDLENLKELMELRGYDKIDVMLSHDAPVNMYAHQGLYNQVFVHPDADKAQDMMAQAVRLTEPSCLIHGHWHMYHTYYYRHTFGLCLDELTTMKYTIQFAILDTIDRTLSVISSQENIVFEIP